VENVAADAAYVNEKTVPIGSEDNRIFFFTKQPIQGGIRDSWAVRTIAAHGPPAFPSLKPVYMIKGSTVLAAKKPVSYFLGIGGKGLSLYLRERVLF
jgi:hypothetical protein